MNFANIPGVVGNPQISFSTLAASTTPQLPQGTLLQAVDPWWGAGEFIYGRANGAIRSCGLCVITPVFNSTLATWRYDVTEVPNTANLGRELVVAMDAMAEGDYGWFMTSGVTPVNCQAAVAADTTFGIAAAGQGGANSAGKQVLGGRVVGASTTTVAKANSVAANASTTLEVTNSDGWFIGVYLSGTGIAAGTTVTGIDPSGRFVTLSLATTAAVNGTVTATYNNATVYFNVARINRPFAQGAIT
jgi:hypothetical protein